MRIGLQLPRFKWPGGHQEIGSRLADIAKTADEGGFYSLWVMDHYFQIPGVGEVTDPMLEGYSTLGYLAGVTEHVKLGTLVSGIVYRYPAILVKAATTLDVLSGGRAYFGVGAAWFERECHGLGVPFPPVAERFEWLEEGLRIAKQMWSEDDGPFHGKHFALEETLCQPQPVHSPYPPIMIGGMGEKKTLKLVAQYADACNIFSRMGADTVAHKFDVLKGHCDDVGRDYDEVERTALGSIHIAPGEMAAGDVIKICQDLAQVGVQHLIFNMPNVEALTPLELMRDEVIPEVAGF
jgi:F420-dependent oxidoreductase-like protein